MSNSSAHQHFGHLFTVKTISNSFRHLFAVGWCPYDKHALFNFRSIKLPTSFSPRSPSLGHHHSHHQASPSFLRSENRNFSGPKPTRLGISVSTSNSGTYATIYTSLLLIIKSYVYTLAEFMYTSNADHHRTRPGTRP